MKNVIHIAGLLCRMYSSDRVRMLPPILFIDARECEALLSYAAPELDPNERGKLMGKYDTDHNGRLSRIEFCRMCADELWHVLAACSPAFGSRPRSDILPAAAPCARAPTVRPHT